LKNNITISDLKKTACWHLNKNLEKLPAKEKNVSKEKQSIQRWLQQYADENNYTLLSEYTFAKPERKFRFDWAIKEIKVAWEYEGIFSKKSRHTTFAGYTTDAEKYNLAQNLGWQVFRYTAINYLNLKVDLLNLKCG
jgi:hypothetical protein